MFGIADLIPNNYPLTKDWKHAKIFKDEHTASSQTGTDN